MRKGTGRDEKAADPTPLTCGFQVGPAPAGEWRKGAPTPHHPHIPMPGHPVAPTPCHPFASTLLSCSLTHKPPLDAPSPGRGARAGAPLTSLTERGVHLHPEPQIAVHVRELGGARGLLGSVAGHPLQVPPRKLRSASGPRSALPPARPPAENVRCGY